MSEKSHYQRIIKYMPTNFRVLISKRTGASPSLISKILKGERTDKHGVILEAYKIAHEQMKKQIKDTAELERLQKELSQYSAA